MQPASQSLAATIASVADRSLPFDLGSLAAIGEGRREGMRRHENLRLRFAHMDVAFEATVRRLDDGSATVRLEADLGPLPYSMEAPEVRRQVLEVLHAARFVGSPVFGLGHDQRILLRADATVVRPITPASVLTAIATLVVGARPFLALLAERLNAAASAA